jgi:hypothetical protein
MDIIIIYNEKGRIGYLYSRHNGLNVKLFFLTKPAKYIAK